MEEKRIALLVGISRYQFATSLSNPNNDVDSMEVTLKKLGFDVIVSKDPNYKSLRISINDFGTRLNDYDVGLFYFAGHGLQIKGFNYLVPVDANPLNENQVEYDCVNANLILSIMEDANNKTNFIFLDACRNNPFERSWNRSPTLPGLSYMSAPYGTLIAYSTAPNKTALDGEIDSNSPYTLALTEEILSPDLTILQVLQNVRLKLIRQTEGEQVPWESTSLLNDFKFNDNIYFSLDTFCQSVMYSKKKDIVLNTLNLRTWDITRITKKGIPLNEMDIQAGVIEVYYQEGLNYFNVFDKLEIKIYKNGEREYNLFTVTRNANHVISISQQLYNRLGVGLYDDNRHSSFFDVDKIKALARGKAKSSKDECFTNWHFESVGFTLYYLNNPKRQFIFKTRIYPNKRVIDRTIKDIFSNEYPKLVKTAIKVGEEKTENAKFEDFQLNLMEPEFGIFDKAILRTFNSGNEKRNSSNLLFSQSERKLLNTTELSSLIAKLTDIYGLDTQNQGYLTGIEVENLETDLHWSGRTWDLNIQHQIMDNDSAIEDMLYRIHLYYYEEDGLNMTIFGLEDLIEYNTNEKRR
ncbi:MAG: caspase domain-containing protein [Cyclobacteriaceae bacterium]